MDEAPRVLIVDDEPDVRLGLRMLAESAGATAREAASAEAAVAVLADWRPHVLLSDITMGRMSGMDLLDETRRRWPLVRVALITGFGTIELAVEAMRRGASHFITKPFDNEEILAVIRQCGREGLAAERMRAASEAGGEGPLVGRSSAMRRVLDLVEQVAPTPMSVLIEGESGTGKELVARALHAGGARRDRPFLAVNTAALPDALLESELFGHAKGAFTGADRERKGLFEQAQGGTVLLDEVGLMSLPFQGKLLRALQERAVVPLGKTRPVPVDFRLLAATSRSLEDRIREGQFREDLYYRLRVVTVAVPPLRERLEDLPALAAHFLSKYARAIEALRPDRPPLSAAALAALMRHGWPGNVRELENCMQRALVLCRGPEILPEHLGLPGDEPAPLSYEEEKQRAVREFQRRYIDRALAASGGNISEAARTCGLTRAALQRILRSLGR